MLKFILSSKLQMNKTSFFNLANNFKMFARKEINKASLIENFHNVNRMESKQQILPNSENFDKKHGEEIFNNTLLFSIGDSKRFIDSNLLNLKQGDSLQNKFLLSIRKSLIENKLLENKKFLDCLNEIAINYSQNNSNFLHSTLFKFLVLIDQILSNKSLVDYQQANVTHFAFAHLIDYFGQNFFKIFDKNSEILLNYNFLYFMTINKGEFSECLKTIMEILPNNQKIYKLLSTQFAITEQSEMEKIHNREYFNFIENNVTTPSSDLIKDYTYKYNERNLKIKLLNENVKEKQEYEKIRLVYHNLIKFRNSNENVNSEFLNELELYLDSFFPQLMNNSENVLTEDYIQVKTSIENFNKFLRNKLSLFTKINTGNKIKDSITFFNIEQIFNPLFSGENDISAQFNIVSEHLGNLYALELLYKYLDTQFEGEVFSFNDLYKLDLILIPFKFSSLNGVYDNVRFINHKQDVLQGIQLNMKTNSKFKISKFFSDEIDRKPKRVEDSRTNFERSPNQGNVRDVRKENEKSNKFGDNVPNQKRETIFYKQQDIKDNLKNIKKEEKKETTVESKIIKENAQPVKKDISVTANISNEASKPLETNKEVKVATEIKNSESDNVMKKEVNIAVEALNVSESLKVEISSQSTQVDLKSSTDDKLHNITPELDKNIEVKETQNNHIHLENQSNLQKNKIKMTSNYDKEKTPVNPFYKPNKRGYCASNSRDKQGEEAIKPLGQVYKEIKLAQQKEKESKDGIKKQESSKQFTPLVSDGKVNLNKQNEKTKKGEVFSPNKPQDSIKESSAIKRSQPFVVPQKQEAIKKEEKAIPAVKKFKSTMKIFEPIKYQKRSPVSNAVEKSTSEENQKVVMKSTFIENLEKLSLELQKQNETFYGIYETTNNDNIDIKLAQKKFDFNYWIEKIYNENIDEMQPEQLEKHIYSVISKVLKKYLSNRDKALMVIYSLTNPELKNEIVLDLEYCFYQIFVNSPHESFDLNLGHVGYQTLLNNNLLDNTIKNRENLEKIIFHMEKNFYLPNAENLKTIMQICDKNFYPKYLKNLIDNYVLNKNIQLDTENFTSYIQIITNFEEFSQYYQNLINNSYTDFRIPVKAEFFEYLIYKYLTKLEFEDIKSALRNFNHRCITEYQDEEERLEQIYGGNNLFLLNIVQFAENARANDNLKIDKKASDSISFLDIKKESTNFIEIVSGVISQNKSFNKDWIEDHEFCFLLMKIYQTFSFEYKEYFTILDNLITKNEVENVFEIKALYNDMLEIFKFNDGKLKHEEHKLALNVFDKFLEKYVKSGLLNLSYEDKFEVIRQENLFKYARFFKNSKDEQDDNTHNMQLFVKFLDSVLDPLTYLRLHKVDKINLEKVLLKVFNSRSRVQEYLYKLDISRKLNETKIEKKTEDYTFMEEIDDDSFDKYSLLDIEDSSLSFKEN